MTKYEKEKLARALAFEFQERLREYGMILDKLDGTVYIVDRDSDIGAEDEDAIYGSIG